MKILKLLSFILCLGLLAPSALAVELGDLPIRHDGRIKPFETFARASLLQLLGRESVAWTDSSAHKTQKISAVEWMKIVLFKADSAKNIPVFLINNPQLLVQIGLKPNENRRYSFKELAQKIFLIDTLGSDANEIEARKRTSDQSEWIRIRTNLLYYKELSHSQEIFLPSPDFSLSASLAQICGLAPGPNSMFQVLQHIRPIALALERINHTPPSSWTYLDQEVIEISRHLYEWSQIAQAKGPQIIAIDGDFLSSNELIQKQVISRSQYQEVISSWAQIVENSHQNKDISSALSSLQSWNDKSPFWRPLAIQVEQQYNHLKPFRYALVFFILASLILLSHFLYKKKWILQVSSILGILGTILVIAGITMRMYITQRPPVTNLYETFLFVGAIVGLLGFILERIGHRINGILLMSFGGMSLTWLSGRFAVDGDTMHVLQAVLDSNFWLSTHVVTISIGYAGVVAAGLAGHLYLLQRIFSSKPDAQESTWKSMMALLGFGLIMSLIGTVLGGVWADQSWGRFWGWDPKENGALLIVLWCSILYHAKMAGWISKIGMALGCGIGMMVVIMAWFGINLLGVGLHSYGFTSGAELKFFAYLGIQTLILAILYGVLKFRHKTRILAP